MAKYISSRSQNHFNRVGVQIKFRLWPLIQNSVGFKIAQPDLKCLEQGLALLVGVLDDLGCGALGWKEYSGDSFVSIP